MKNLLLIAALSLFTVPGVHAQKTKVQDNDVPQAVMTAFDRQYPNTSDVNWKMKDGSYKAKFTMSGTKHLAEFNSAGTLTKTGVAIPKQDLPSVVTSAINREYTSTNTGDIYRVQKDGQTHFLVEIDGRTGKTVIYDEQGNVVREKQKR